MDYWKIPFRCFNCREVGHVLKDCPKVATKPIYKKICAYEAFLILYIFSIWEARNRAIFNNSWTPPDITISLLISKVQEHKRDVPTTKTRIIRDLVINREIPWDFFDGASQGEPPLEGAGEVINVTANRKIMIKYAMGQATNNRAELSALWATMKVAHSNRIQDIRIFGDSKVVIDWENGRNTIRVPYLQHFLTEIHNLKALFRRISFAHIYRELNEEADSLSKQALAYQPRLMEIEEIIEGTPKIIFEMI